MPYMFTCSRANVSFVLKCSCANVPCVLTCLTYSHANVPTYSSAIILNKKIFGTFSLSFSYEIKVYMKSAWQARIFIIQLYIPAFFFLFIYFILIWLFNSSRRIYMSNSHRAQVFNGCYDIFVCVERWKMNYNRQQRCPPSCHYNGYIYI